MADEFDPALEPVHEEPESPDAPAEDEHDESGEPVFTKAQQERIGKMLAAERRKAREAALKESQARQPQPAPPRTEKRSAVPTADLQSQIDALNLQLGFEKAVRKYQLNDQQVETLQALASAARPENVAEWIGTTVESLGLSQRTTANTSTNGNGISAPRPSGPPASDRGGPAPTSDGLRNDNPLAWTSEDVQRMRQSKGTDAEGIQFVRNRTMAALRNVGLYTPRGPRGSR